MVHALKEIHRILKPDGTFIDLRPQIGNRQVLVELSNATLLAGEVDSSATEPDKIAANQAIQQVLSEGIFTEVHHTFFDSYADLDTPDDLREYGKSLIASILPESVIERVVDLTADEEDDYRIRVRRAFTIAQYRKSP